MDPFIFHPSDKVMVMALVELNFAEMINYFFSKPILNRASMKYTHIVLPFLIKHLKNKIKSFQTLLT